MSHPWTVNSSLFQWMLRASPHMGLRARLSEVTARHSPAGPAQTSGGAVHERRIRAKVRPSAATDMAVCSLALMDSSPIHRRSTWPVVGSSCEMPAPPSRVSAKTIRPGVGHAIDSYGGGNPRRQIAHGPARPPAADATKISPPVTSSSLIRPPMKAIDLPSGDQRGFSICCCAPGWKIGFASFPLGGNRVELGDPPVVVADAMRGGGGESLAVGRPVVFVDVKVGGRDLAGNTGSGIDNRDALFEDLLFHNALVGSFGLERAGHTRRIFGEEYGNRFAVGRPARMSEIPGKLVSLCAAPPVAAVT